MSTSERFAQEEFLDLLSWPTFFFDTPVMIETNPIHFRIADLRARVASLRGYL
ncbi:MAG: hypothetical protein JSR65_02365 [Proteobacteria bacterium]|nr:hypothetical protein [Pseudomonadota bacterium]